MAKIGIVTLEQKAVVIEVPHGPRGQTDFPAGTNTGDIIRYNATTGDWESCAEPFEFKGIVLVPMALPGAPVDGMVGFNIADNGLYVAVP